MLGQILQTTQQQYFFKKKRKGRMIDRQKWLPMLLLGKKLVKI